MYAQPVLEMLPKERLRQPGNLVFIRGTQGIAGPIKRLTNSPYTHVAGFVLPNQLIEAQSFRKTGYEEASTYAGVADVYACQQLTPAQRLGIVRQVTREIGTSYDYFLVGLLGITLLLKRSNLRYRNPRRQICTTLWVDAYKSVNLDLCPGIDHPTPGDLAKSTLLTYVGSL